MSVEAETVDPYSQGTRAEILSWVDGMEAFERGFNARTFSPERRARQAVEDAPHTSTRSLPFGLRAEWLRCRVRPTPSRSAWGAVLDRSCISRGRAGGSATRVDRSSTPRRPVARS